MILLRDTFVVLDPPGRIMDADRTMIVATRVHNPAVLAIGYTSILVGWALRAAGAIAAPIVGQLVGERTTALEPAGFACDAQKTHVQRSLPCKCQMQAPCKCRHTSQLRWPTLSYEGYTWDVAGAAVASEAVLGCCPRAAAGRGRTAAAAAVSARRRPAGISVWLGPIRGRCDSHSGSH